MKTDYYVTSDNLDDKTSVWLKKIEPFNQHPMKLNCDKSAQLVIDM